MADDPPILSHLIKDVFKTLNKRGYSSVQLDSYIQLFLDAIKPKMHVLDVGSAFGFITLQALKRQAYVTANDLEKEHLKILKQNTPVSLLPYLTLIEGRFPDHLAFPPASFDLIVFSQVLHFLPGEQILKGLQQAFDWLKPNGKIFITATTPYAKVMKKFFPIYKERKELGLPWPGTVKDLSLYCDNEEILYQNFGNTYWNYFMFYK